MKLRFYQQECVDSIFEYFNENSGNPLCCLPTGTGKSVIIAAFIKAVIESYQYEKIIMLTHVGELVKQNFEKLESLCPTVSSGIHCSELKRKDSRNQIIYGTIQSVAATLKSKGNIFGHFSLMLVDEAHMIDDKETSMYNFAISMFKEVNPNLKVIGFTATPYRMRSGRLNEGGLFTDICYDITQTDKFNKLIELGFLARLIPKPTKLKLDLSEVKMRMGDYNQTQVDGLVDNYETTYAAIQELLYYGDDYKSWLIFANSIKHAEHINEVLNANGILSDVSHSKMGNSHNKEVIDRFKSGELRALVNKDKLTTGFDHPNIDLIAVFRPTMSVGLWVQMLGRGTRPIEGKDHCLVLDFAGNTERLGPINNPVIPEKREKGDGSCPVKICPSCNTYQHTSVRQCELCGFDFPFNFENKLENRSSNLKLIDDGIKEPDVIEEFNIDNVYYEKHEKRRRNGTLISPPSLKVTYVCGDKSFNEWVCLENSGYAGDKAKKWWFERNLEKAPVSVDAAIDKTYSLRKPKKLFVKTNSKYPEVKNYVF